MVNIFDARMKLFNFFVDTLVDLADPSDDDYALTVDDMRQVTELFFEGLDLEVISVDGDRCTFSAKLTG